jgi:transposase-like protein
MLVLQKVLPPSSMSVHTVSKDTGISVQTIYKWMKQVENDTLVPKMTKETEPRFKSTLEKFTLLLESKTIPEEQFGEWLRKNGIHSDHLTLWEQELANNMSKKAVDVESLQAEYKDLQKKYKILEREKDQTEAALKEMSALYTLKKKLESILGEAEED